MIDVVYTGWNPGGLIRYVFGPGRYNEHENPRVVASFDGRPEAWQPERTGPGEFDFDLDPLIAAAQAPLKVAGLPVTTPNPDLPAHRRYFRTQPDGTRKLRTGTVRHLTLRNASEDRELTAREWEFVATELMHRSGWSRRDDPAGPRWWAVQHDRYGIHVFAVMVHQESGERVRPWNDYAKLRKAARSFERRYGITLTAEADETAQEVDPRGAVEKAARQGRVPAREELRAAVAQAAAASVDVHGFTRGLRDAGYLVEILRLPSGDVRGYKVARTGDVNASGEPIWYSGSKLAADLSLPKLLRRWGQARRGRDAASGDSEPVSAQVWVQRTTLVVDQARQVLARDPGQVEGIAHAVGELHVALDRGAGRLVHGPGARWDRAARAPYTPVPETARLAEEMRWLARGLSATGGSASVELAASLTALGLQIAALLSERGRGHQARAARQASRWVSQPPASRPAPRPTPRIRQRRASGASTAAGRGRKSVGTEGAGAGPSSVPPRSWSPRPRGPGRGPGR